MFDLYYMDCNIYLDQSVPKIRSTIQFHRYKQGASAVIYHIWWDLHKALSVPTTHSIGKGSSIGLLYFIANFLNDTHDGFGCSWYKCHNKLFVMLRCLFKIFSIENLSINFKKITRGKFNLTNKLLKWWFDQ